MNTLATLAAVCFIGCGHAPAHVATAQDWAKAAREVSAQQVDWAAGIAAALPAQPWPTDEQMLAAWAKCAADPECRRNLTRDRQ